MVKRAGDFFSFLAPLIFLYGEERFAVVSFYSLQGADLA